MAQIEILRISRKITKNTFYKNGCAIDYKYSIVGEKCHNGWFLNVNDWLHFARWSS